MLLEHVFLHSHKSGQVFLFCHSGSSLVVNVTLQLVSAYCHSPIGSINSTVVLGGLAGEWLQLLVFLGHLSLALQEDVSSYRSLN